MDYYKGSLYFYSGEFLYIYSLKDNIWTSRMPLGKEYTMLIAYAQCVYNDALYLILGWDDNIGGASEKIYRIDLSSDKNEFEEIFISNEGIADYTFGYDCKDNLVYLFGGSSVDYGYFNNLSILDLSQQDLEFKVFNKAMNVPTARKGHAMQAYDDKLYIFGGVDADKKR
jgi:N-acetylneuraminic acid mutarotase